MRDFLDPYGFKMPEIVGSGGYTFSAQYQTVYDSFVVKPAADIAQQQDIMVRALVAAGLWAKYDAFYITANNDRANSKINWINPGTYDLVEQNGPIAFVPYRGFTGNGVNQFFKTGFIPSVAAGNYTQNEAHLSAYSRTNVAADWDIGSVDANRDCSCTSGVGGNAIIKINDNTNGIVANPNTLGSFIWSRLAANSRHIFKNGVSIFNDAIASVLINTQEIYFGAYNNGGVGAGFSAREYCSGSIGGAITVAEAPLFFNPLETCLDYIGAGIV